MFIGRKSMLNAMLAIMTFAIFLAFQNCTGTQGSGTQQYEQSKHSSNGFAALEGNGGGYPGKAKFVNLDLKNSCQSPNNRIVEKSKIIIDNNNDAFLVKKDCVDIPPTRLPVESYSSLQHSPNYLLSEKNIFQTVETPQFSEVAVHFCRGTSTLNSGEAYTVDAKVYQNLESGELVMDYSLAQYDPNGVSFTVENLEKKPATTEESTDTIQFTSTRTFGDFFSSFEEYGFNSYQNSMFSRDIGEVTLEINKHTLKGEIRKNDVSSTYSSTVASDLDCFEQ